MDIELGFDSEKFIRDEVVSGRFASPRAVVEAAIDLLRRVDAETGLPIDDLRALIDEGIGGCDRGEFVEVDTERLDEFAARIIAESKREDELGRRSKSA